MIACIFDTETSGLWSSELMDLDKQPHVIEFMSMTVNLDTEEKVRELEFLCKPPILITKEITGITNITNEMLENERPFSEYIGKVKSEIESVDAVIAHNLAFDYGMINIEARRCGIEIKWPRLICSVEQSLPLKGYHLSLTNLHKELFGSPFVGAHRARNDVEALVKCVIGLKNLGCI